MVVELMQKFMEAGFPQETAIRMMNSAMVLQGDRESYSTLDFMDLDLYSGQMTITKIGAAASFLKQKDRVECLRASTLPAGVDASCTGDVIHRKLTHGDFVVMVTDGVLEYLHVPNPEETMQEIIESINTNHPGILAKKILERVLLFTGGKVSDDMTILVTCIWEK